MTSFSEQMKIHRAAREATASLEFMARSEISRIFDQWDSGELTNRNVRYRLEGIVRNAYRTSAGIARGVAQKNAEITGWESFEVFESEYLKDLLIDVRRNLKSYKSGTLTREQAILRIQHSAGVASQRGYTDQLIESYTELEDFGFSIRKYWVANFVNNVPCPACTRLHGTHVGLHETFSAEVGEPGVYRDLIGPPRHPRCKCGLYMFVVTLENAFETPNFEQPQDTPDLMTTEEVKGMTKGFFSLLLASLRTILKMIRKIL